MPSCKHGLDTLGPRKLLSRFATNRFLAKEAGYYLRRVKGGVRGGGLGKRGQRAPKGVCPMTWMQRFSDKRLGEGGRAKPPRGHLKNERKKEGISLCPCGSQAPFCLVISYSGGGGGGGAATESRAVIQIPSGLKMWESQTWAGKPGGWLAVPFKEAGPIT